MPLRTLCAVALCLPMAILTLGTSIRAQRAGSQGPRPTFATSTDLVRLEVSVLDKARHPVRGLTPADFVVLENGRERPVVAFTPVELPAPAAPPAVPVAAWVRDAPTDVVSNADAGPGRLVVIAFDWSIRMDDQPLARRIALTTVDALGPTDEAAVIFTKPNGAAGRPQGFTTDRAWLRTAIQRPFAAALTCPPGGKCDASSSTIVDPEGYGSGECLCGMCTLEALTQLAQTLRTVSQRPKVVFFIGTYVRTFEVMQPTHIPPVLPGVITPAFTSMPGATDCSGRLLETRRAFERAAAEANITVHVLDPVGLETDGNSPLGIKRMRERLDTLPVMADMTGGRTVLNTNAPETQVASILDESSSYYLLGFTPGSGGRGDTARSIEVRVRPRGLMVKARSRYTLQDEAVAATSGGTALARAASAVLPGDDAPLEVSAVPMIAGRRGAALVVARVPQGGPRPSAMLTAAFTPRAVPVVSRRLHVRGGGDGAVVLVSALALQPGFYELRVATESAGGATGSVHTFVEIPDFAREPLAMSGPLLHASPEEPTAPREEVDGVLPFAPTTRRAFDRAATVSAFVQITQGTGRNDALHDVTLGVRVLDSAGTAVREESFTLSPGAFAQNRTANRALTLPIRGLASGRYLLELTARAGDRRAERAVRFEIQ